MVCGDPVGLSPGTRGDMEWALSSVYVGERRRLF